MASEPKVFMAKFVRGASLPAAFGSQRTPELLQELRGWMDRRAATTGLDAGPGDLWIGLRGVIYGWFRCFQGVFGCFELTRSSGPAFFFGLKQFEHLSVPWSGS